MAIYDAAESDSAGVEVTSGNIVHYVLLVPAIFTTVSVGRAEAQGSMSTFPLTDVVGAISVSASQIAILPTSPALSFGKTPR